MSRSDCPGLENENRLSFSARFFDWLNKAHDGLYKDGALDLSHKTATKKCDEDERKQKTPTTQSIILNPHFH